MSIKFLNAVFESDIGPVGKRMVLLALADNANDAGFCKPGIAYLVGKTEVARSTCFRILEQLEEEQLLQRAARRRSNGSRRSNAYRLNHAALVARKRIVSNEERDELEALFDDEPVADETAGQPHSPGTGRWETPGQPHSPAAGRGGSRSGTGVVPQRDGGSPAAGRAGGPAAVPLEPSVEPPEEPPLEPARSARSAREPAPKPPAAAPPAPPDPVEAFFGPDDDTGPDPHADPDRVAAAALGRRRSRAARSPAAWNATAHSPDAHRLVAEYVVGRVVPTRTRTQLHVEVTDLLRQGVSEPVLKAALVELGAKGLAPAALSNIVASVANRRPPAEPQSRAEIAVAGLVGAADRYRKRHGMPPAEPVQELRA